MLRLYSCGARPAAQTALDRSETRRRHRTNGLVANIQCLRSNSPTLFFCKRAVSGKAVIFVAAFSLLELSADDVNPRGAKPQDQHVQDNKKVDRQQDPFKRMGMADDRQHFPRKIKAS